MRFDRISTLGIAGVSALGLLAGCSVGDPSRQSVATPHVAALSAYEGRIGTTIQVFGQNFVTDENVGRPQLVFEGEFRDQNGATERVNTVVDAEAVDSGRLNWNTFGPYSNPLSASGDKIGTFRGTVTAQTLQPDGNTVRDSQPLALTFTVQPSIVVREFQPTNASCAAPAIRGIGNTAYRLRVEALGFTPTSYTYTLTVPAPAGNPTAQPTSTSIRHIARGTTDTLGNDGNFVLPEIPESDLSYRAVISIQATDDRGGTHQAFLGIGVHRPLEIYYNGNVAIAETLAPTPVSACTPGGEAGRTVGYSESETETRMRSYNVNWDMNWLDSHTTSTMTSTTIGMSNSVSLSTTNGQSFSYSTNRETSGMLGLNTLIGASVNHRRGSTSGNESSSSTTQGRTSEESISRTEATTDSTTRSVGGSTGAGWSTSVSSSETISRDFNGRIIAGQYGVFYRQAVRLLRRASVVTYNLCGSAQIVGDVDLADWTWSPDLAQAAACPPLPQSNLPAAACHIPPCGGQ